MREESKSIEPALERIVLDGFAAYWWLGDRAARQLAAAALAALNRAGQSR